MRNVVVTEFLTLDGVMENPQLWSFPFWSDQIAAFKFAELSDSDTLLLGRVTYEGFAAAWPQRAGNGDAYTEMMNSYPKHVASTTLQNAEWNNSQVIGGDVAEAVAALKQQPGKNILVFGSSDLVQTLAAHDLVDEYRLLVYPIVVGNGKPLFQPSTQQTLTLVESTPYDTGVVLLRYQPQRVDTV